MREDTQREKMKAQDLVNKTLTGTGLDDNVRSLVRRAYMASVAEVHGLMSREVGVAWRRAASIATGRDLDEDDILNAALFDEGL